MLLLMFYIHVLVLFNIFPKYSFQPIQKNTFCFPHKNYIYSQSFQRYDIVIRDISTNVLPQFWKSTGLCPPDPHQQSFNFFLSNDLKQNLFHIGSLPFKGISQVRIHWLLDSISIKVDSNFTVSYNFTYLDGLIYELWKNDLYLGFELMGNPSNYYTDFENNTQVYMWRDLVKNIANHYIALYGIEYIMKWNFETWNEPDHHDFDNLNFTVQGFLNYYDACSEGLKLADKRLKFGGPGGSCRIPKKGHSPLCWAMLEHCVKGKNYFTGEIGSRLDFISFHKKGNGSSSEILIEERETIDYIRSNTKISYSVPFYNDEADPLKNWALPQTWRADTTYAAMAVKIILKHIEEYYIKNETKGVHFNLLSNDNAFLSYFPYQFTERTLLARFQVNDTNPKYVQFIKKPVYAIFGLLSQLCPNILSTKVYKEGKEVVPVSDFGIIATHCISNRNQVAIVMYNSVDTLLSNITYDVNLILNFSLSSRNAKMVIFEINNVDTNPYFIWENLGKPTFPTTHQFASIKNYEEPQIYGPWNIESLSPWKHCLHILNPGVTMINICRKRQVLKEVENVRFLQITNNSLQISWTDNHNRCVLSYNVEYSVHAQGPYIQLNKKNVVFPSYWHSCFEKDPYCTILGFYRVYAIDYWYIHGPFSVPVKYTQY